MDNMADGQLENSEINRSPGNEKSSVQELQNVLLSKNFQRTANAYRVLEMTSMHSKNLFSSFPDAHRTIDGGHVENSYFNKQKLRLDEEQEKMLRVEIEKGKDLVSDALLFTCHQDLNLVRNNQMRFQNGHAIIENEMPLSVPITISKQQLEAMLKEEVSAASMRGLFIKMGGAFSGTYILLLDGGRSRWLYDWHREQGQKDRFAQGVISALKSDDQCQYGKWIKDTDSRVNSQLVISDYDYNIESVIPIQ